MAKRFIDTDLFRKPFMRSLEAPYKALWVYLVCECDHAGVWDVEMDVATMRLGMKLDPDKALAKMGSAVVPIDGGKKWWIPEYITFQYGTLNPANKVHASALAILSKYGIDPENIAPPKDLPSPLQGAKDKDKDKDKVKDKEEGPRELKWPAFAGEKCKAKWAEYIAYKAKEHGKRYKSVDTEQKALDLVLRYFPTGPQFVSGLDHTMAKNWQQPVDPAETKYPDVGGVQTPPVILNANGKPQQLKPWVN